MLRSGSDRIGALDFQASPSAYVARETPNATLADLLTAAEFVDRGQDPPPELAEALQHGSSVGGARPKALLEDGGRKYVAKFSSSTDTFSAVKAEFVAMRLARLAGLNAAPVMLTQALGRDVFARGALRSGADWPGLGSARRRLRPHPVGAR